MHESKDNGTIQKCPKCGSNEVTLYDTHDSYAFGTLPGIDDPVRVVMAYKCVCGVAFTEMVKYRKPELTHA